MRDAYAPPLPALRGNAQERFVSEALERANRTPDELRDMPPSWVVDPFPPRLVGERPPPLTIEEIMDVNVAGKSEDWRTWVSGGPADFSSTARPSGQGWW